MENDTRDWFDRRGRAETFAEEEDEQGEEEEEEIDQIDHIDH